MRPPPVLALVQSKPGDGLTVERLLWSQSPGSDSSVDKLSSGGHSVERRSLALASLRAASQWPVLFHCSLGAASCYLTSVSSVRLTPVFIPNLSTRCEQYSTRKIILRGKNNVWNSVNRKEGGMSGAGSETISTETVHECVSECMS